jgi:hypothetical protein
MTPSEIIKADHERFGHSQADTARLMETMQAMIQKNVGRLIQNGNTLLFLVNLDKKSASVSIYTADSPQKIKSSLAFFIKQVKKSGFKKVYGEDGGPVLQKTLQLLKNLGVNVQKSDKPKFLWMAEL